MSDRRQVSVHADAGWEESLSASVRAPAGDYSVQAREWDGDQETVIFPADYDALMALRVVTPGGGTLDIGWIYRAITEGRAGELTF